MVRSAGSIWRQGWGWGWGAGRPMLSQGCKEQTSTQSPQRKNEDGKIGRYLVGKRNNRPHRDQKWENVEKQKREWPTLRPFPPGASRCQLPQADPSPPAIMDPVSQAQVQSPGREDLTRPAWWGGDPVARRTTPFQALCLAVGTPGQPLWVWSTVGGGVHILPLQAFVTVTVTVTITRASGSRRRVIPSWVPPGSLMQAICAQAGLNYSLFLNKGGFIPTIWPPGARAQLPVCALGQSRSGAQGRCAGLALL